MTITRTPLREQVHRAIVGRILRDELAPGSRVSDSALAQELGVSRTPVREALLRLQGEGLVSRKRGWVVEAPDAANFRSIFEARIAVEGYAARVAAQRVTKEALSRIEGVMIQMEATDKPRSEINRLNRQFHVEIVAASENVLFAEMHQRTQFQYWNLRLPVVFLKEQLAKSTEQHRQIFKALKAKDSDRAERAAREHIETTMHIVAEALEGE